EKAPPLRRVARAVDHKCFSGVRSQTGAGQFHRSGGVSGNNWSEMLELVTMSAKQIPANAAVLSRHVGVLGRPLTHPFEELCAVATKHVSIEREHVPRDLGQWLDPTLDRLIDTRRYRFHAAQREFVHEPVLPIQQLSGGSGIEADRCHIAEFSSRVTKKHGAHASTLEAG